MQARQLILDDLGIESPFDRGISITDAKLDAVFPYHQLHIVSGSTGHFEYFSPPSGSFCYYATTKNAAFCLNKESLSLLLKQYWHSIPQFDLVSLVELMLKIYYLKEYLYWIYKDIDDLHRGGRAKLAYTVDESYITPVRDVLGSTQIDVREDTYFIRAIALRGERLAIPPQELGIENIEINRNGDVSVGDREILCDRTFIAEPFILH